MPYKLKPPKPGRSPYWRVRGSEFGISIDRSTQTRDKREANQILTRWREAAKRRSISGASESAPTFGSAVLSYIRAGHSKRFLEPLIRFLAETPVDAIEQAMIDHAAAILYPGATPQTRNRQVYSVIIAILRHIGIATPIRRPRWRWADAHRIMWLRPQEAFALLNAADSVDDRLGALLTFLLYCGPRLSEALRLEWGDVDLGGATATIKQAKNGKPLVVHLPPEAVAALADLPRRRARVFGLTKCKRARRKTHRQKVVSLPEPWSQKVTGGK
jgi:integrase